MIEIWCNDQVMIVIQPLDQDPAAATGTPRDAEAGVVALQTRPNGDSRSRAGVAIGACCVARPETGLVADRLAVARLDRGRLVADRLAVSRTAEVGSLQTHWQ